MYSILPFLGLYILNLISACWKPSMKKRLEIVNEIAKERGLTGDIKQEDFLKGTDEENKQFMKTALRRNTKSHTRTHSSR